MSPELLSILVLAVVHLIGVAAIVGMLAGDDGGFRGWWPRDDPGDGGSPRDDDGPRAGGPPLADAGTSTLRLRGGGKLADSRRIERRRSVEPGRPAVPARDHEQPLRHATAS